jgi:heterodisulfide reductase subunit A-like polyferredoxin
LEGVKGLQFSQKGTLEVDERTLSTPVKGVFAAGDAVMGPGSIAAAIGSGRLTAISVASYLSGQNMEQIKGIVQDKEGHLIITEYDEGERKRMPQQVVGFDEILNPEYYAKKNRVPMHHLPPDEAATGFQEIQRGYSREEALFEANRCFHCGHCALCGTCAEICPMDVIAMGEEGPEVVYPKECWHCGGCRINCPCGSVYYEFPLSMLI